MASSSVITNTCSCTTNNERKQSYKGTSVRTLALEMIKRMSETQAKTQQSQEYYSQDTEFRKSNKFIPFIKERTHLGALITPSKLKDQNYSKLDSSSQKEGIYYHSQKSILQKLRSKRIANQSNQSNSGSNLRLPTFDENTNKELLAFQQQNSKETKLMRKKINQMKIEQITKNFQNSLIDPVKFETDHNNNNSLSKLDLDESQSSLKWVINEKKIDKNMNVNTQIKKPSINLSLPKLSIVDNSKYFQEDLLGPGTYEADYHLLKKKQPSIIFPKSKKFMNLPKQNQLLLNHQQYTQSNSYLHQYKKEKQQGYQQYFSNLIKEVKRQVSQEQKSGQCKLMHPLDGYTCVPIQVDFTENFHREMRQKYQYAKKCLNKIKNKIKEIE